MTWLLKGEPFEAQETALMRTANEPHGYAYFMEMGLGKTAVIIAEFMKLAREQKVDKLVVVCPNSLKKNWAREIQDWTDNTLTCGVWPDTTPNKTHVLNYEAFSGGARKGESFVRDLCEESRVMLVLDESTQIKNNQSVRTKSLLGTSRMAEYTRILSGAPMVQGPQDIWAQLKFIGEFRGVNFYQFRNRYCRMGGYMGKKIVGPNPDTIGEIHRILDRCAFRARKEDWLDIPPKMYYTRDIDQSPAQKRHYKSMVQDFVTLINGEEIEAAMVITQMGKLQQISSNFVYDEAGKVQKIDGPNHKLNEIKQILEEIEGRAIIVTYFTHSTENLLEELEGYGAVGIYGGLSDDEIEQAKKEFNEGEARVIVCQSSAAKYGHTLLGSKDLPCHTTIFYENSFSLDDRIQIEDRNHRIGQKHGVNIIDLPSSGVEMKVIKALQQKQDISEAIIDAIKVQRV